MTTHDLLNLTVSQVMTTDLFIVKTDTLVQEINDIFEREQIHHLPVINDEGHIKGIISKTDIFLLLDWGTRKGLQSSIQKNQGLMMSNMAKDIMTTHIVSVMPEDPVTKCVQLFRENYFRALPVIDSLGRLCGMITIYDLMIRAYTANSD
ncbi:MAG: CBS domain-containing protein [Saprospiraceae bacterium]